MSKPHRDVAKRFWTKVLKRGPDQCWPWKASTTVGGYGQFGCTYEWLGQKDRPGWTMVTAQRIAWILTNGPIPNGLDILHKCDNPPCCNPAHLFCGTQIDNVEDMLKKGRHGHGTTGGPRKHDERFIQSVLAEYASTDTPLDHLAAKYEISASHLRRHAKRAGIPLRRRIHKITPAKAKEIRELYATGNYTYFDLAAKYDVTFANVGYIVRGHTFSSQ